MDEVRPDAALFLGFQVMVGQGDHLVRYLRMRRRLHGRGNPHLPLVTSVEAHEHQRGGDGRRRQGALPARQL